MSKTGSLQTLRETSPATWFMYFDIIGALLFHLSKFLRRFGKIERRFILLKQRFTPPETAFCQAWNEASERQKITFLTMEAKKNGLQG